VSPSFPTIEVIETEWGGAARIAPPQSPSLLDACEDSGAPVPFNCRGASCSTCRIRVLEGAELLEPPNEIERELLEAYKQPPEVRVACSAELRACTGTLRIEPLGPVD
jgi:ferredoxin